MNKSKDMYSLYLQGYTPPSVWDKIKVVNDDTTKIYKLLNIILGKEYEDEINEETFDILITSEYCTDNSLALYSFLREGENKNERRCGSSAITFFLNDLIYRATHEEERCQD